VTPPAPPRPREAAELSFTGVPVEAPEAGGTFDNDRTPLLDSRVLAVGGDASVLAVPLPSLSLPAIAPEPAAGAAPWEAVSVSAVSAAGEVARAAAGAGARARSTGVSIGRWVARAGKAGANVF
jgi:hypothetical protein